MGKSRNVKWYDKEEISNTKFKKRKRVKNDDRRFQRQVKNALRQNDIDALSKET